ncbi:hypothetical protein JRO89_XS05G0004500 [Xanthoceras sorbifolium]|uniref:Uncharacterized protein n=1 Tax=Xanthoceras sorbifolium TaxID=99658 RepID=A0ABQ8HZM6_9ROSI|nr:hypothetical protein JRO89_XS05G0004500 [Xanthoceras sorbifolium]
MTVDEVSNSSVWSKEQDKAFENAIATYPEDASDLWEKIATDVPGKTLEEIKHHYELLVEDVNRIESGCVPLPSYNSSSDGSTSHAGDEGTGKKSGHYGHYNPESNHGSKSSRSDQERRKGIAWTEDEHRVLDSRTVRVLDSRTVRVLDQELVVLESRAVTVLDSRTDRVRKKLNKRESKIEKGVRSRRLQCEYKATNGNLCHVQDPNYGYNLSLLARLLAIGEAAYVRFMIIKPPTRLFLLGLDKYGKGDWRSISRNFVVTRTPTQVASHAQKYFIRLNSMNKDRRRSSIHDITSVGNGDISASQAPITGQTNGSAAGSSSGKSNKQPPQHPAGPPGIGMYGAPTIGQPIGGPLVSAVGTPVNLPAPTHMAYGVRAPVPGAVVPGAPMNVGPMPYPMPHTSAHR